MSKEMKDTNSNFSDTKKNFENMKDSAANTAKSAYAEISNDHIKEIVSRLTHDLGDFFKNRKDDFSNVKSKSKNQIKESPFLFVIGALAIGALIGMICKK